MADQPKTLGSAPPEPPVSSGAAGGDSQPTAPPRRRPSGLVPQRGRRELKEYPLTDSDMHDLRNIGAGATFCFSLGSLCLGFWSNLYASLAFSDVAKNLLAVGTARQQDALIGAIFFYCIGAILVVMGFTRVADIKAEVDFGDGDQRPNFRLKFIIRTVVLIALLGASFWFGTRYPGRG